MENQYSFEEYNKIGGRFTPTINLGISGGIVISAGFSKKYDIANAVGIKLFYDKARNAVGVKFLKEAEDGMLKLKMSAKGGAYVNAKSFLIKFDIDQKVMAGKYDPKEISTPNGKMYVIELKSHL